jgi:2-polyprenyl-6-methoxyphenol hydroxylase-like FAD-dependent oxidoreductase
MNKKKLLKDAIVIGGSIAGLMTARVLADNAENVVVLEKDTVPAKPESHKTVPQGNHIHVILGQGKDFLESCFPGILQEIKASGGNIVDSAKDVSWFFQGSWRTRHTSGMTSLLSLRPHTEWHFRNRLLAEYPNVTIRENCQVNGFLSNEDNTRVTGVKFKRPGGDLEKMTCDLVVDSSGFASQTPDWISGMGYERPPETEIGIGLCYTSTPSI